MSINDELCKHQKTPVCTTAAWQLECSLNSAFKWIYNLKSKNDFNRQ